MGVWEICVKRAKRVGKTWEIAPKMMYKPLIYKNRNRKKVLSLVLCVAVMLSVMVLGAGAAFSDQDQIENTEAVDACSALNIIGGYEDGSFHPERNIKRSEITKMICVALNGGQEPNVSTNAVPTFSDVRGTSAEWAEGYIESCVAQGIVSGVGGGRFAPDGNVTGAQLAKMLLVCLGYNSDNEGFTGNAWETNVNVRAAQKSLYAGLEDMDTSAAVTRDQAAQMVWNALNAYEVEYKTTLVTDENGNLVSQVTVQDKVVNSNNDKITLLTDKYEAYVNVGTLESINGQDLKLYMTTSDKEDSDKDSLDEFTNVSTDYSALLGQKVKVMFTKANNVLGVYATNDNTTYTVNMKDISADGNKVELDSGTYAFDDGASIAVVTLDVNNETVVTGNTMTAANFDTDANKVNPSIVTFVDNDGDGKLNIAIITEYLAKEVTYVGSDRITAGATYKMADENIASDIAQDDYAMISYNMYDNCLDIVKAEVVTDTLNSSKDKTGYKQYEIGSTWYNIDASASTTSGYDKVALGDSVKAHIVAGVIVSIDTDDGTGAIPTNIAVVVGNGTGTTLYGDQAKLRFYDGTLKTVTVSTSSNGVAASATKIGAAYKVSGSDSSTKLETLTTGNKYNGYTFASSASVYAGTGAAITADADGTVDKINGTAISDTAAIILYDSDGNSKVITGKQLKSINADALDGKGTDGINSVAMSYFTKSVDGLTRVTLASVSVADTSISGTSYDNYGYIVSDGVDKANGDVEFRMWTGSENVTVKVEKATASDYTKGTLVAYASIDENSYLLDATAFDTMENIAAAGNAGVKGAYAGSNLADSTSSISIDDAIAKDASLNVTADTHVLVVDSDANAADDIGQPYTYGTTKLASAAKDENGSYRINAVYRVDGGAAPTSGDDLDLVVVDVTGAFDFDKPESTVTPPAPDAGKTYATEDELKDALNDSDVVATGVIPAGTYDSQNELTLKDAKIGGAIVSYGDVTLDGTTTFSSNGSLEVLGTLTINDDATVDLTKLTAATIVDKRTNTTTTDLAKMLATGTNGADATDVTVQSTTVDDTITLTGKKLTVVGKLTTGATLPTAAAGEIDAASVDASAVTAPDGENVATLFGYSNDVTLGNVSLSDQAVTLTEGQTLTVAEVDTTAGNNITVADGATLKVSDVTGLKVNDSNGINVAAGAAVELGTTKYVGPTSDYLMTVADGTVYRYGNTAKWTVKGEIVMNQTNTLENDNFDLSDANAKITVASGVIATFKNATISDGAKIVGEDGTAKVTVDTALTVTTNYDKFTNNTGTPESGTSIAVATYEWQTSGTWKANT